MREPDDADFEQRLATISPERWRALRAASEAGDRTSLRRALTEEDLGVAFDWMNWPGLQKTHDLAWAEASTPADALRMLVVVLRLDRFVEGAFDSMVEGGMVSAVITRLIVTEFAPFEPALAADLTDVRAALEDVEPPYVEWVTPPTAPGHRALRYPQYSPEVGRLRTALGAAGFAAEFPWSRWSRFSLYDDPASLATAPVLDAVRRIASTLWAERPMEGTIAGELEAGRLQAAISRVLEYRSTHG